MINRSGADDETSCPDRKELHVLGSSSSGPIYIKVGYHQAACTRTRNPLRCNNTFLLYQPVKRSGDQVKPLCLCTHTRRKYPTFLKASIVPRQLTMFLLSSVSDI